MFCPLRKHYIINNAACKITNCGKNFSECLNPIAKFATYEALCEYCDSIFAKEKAEGRIIEGVVVRTMYTNDLSCKYMNPEYDAKK